MKKTCANQTILVNNDRFTYEIKKGLAIGISGNKVEIHTANFSYEDLRVITIGLLMEIFDTGLGVEMGGVEDIMENCNIGLRFEMSEQMKLYFGDDADAGLQDNS